MINLENFNAGITSEQVNSFATRVKELTGPFIPSDMSLPPEYGEVGIMNLEARAHYQLGADNVYVNDIDPVTGYPLHLVSLVIVGPKVPIDQGRYSVTTKSYRVDLETSQPGFEEKKTEHNAQTGKLLRTQQEVGGVTTEWRPEELPWSRERIHEFTGTLHLVDTDFYGFNQTRFREAMVILGQLGQHNRVS